MSMETRRFEWLCKTRDYDFRFKGFLVLLLNYLKSHNECWPSNKALAVDGNLTEKTVARYLKELEKTGLITITNGERPRGHSTGRILHFHFPGEEEASETELLEDPWPGKPEETSEPVISTDSGEGKNCEPVSQSVISSPGGCHSVPAEPVNGSDVNRSFFPTGKVLESKDPESEKNKRNQVPGFDLEKHEAGIQRNDATLTGGDPSGFAPEGPQASTRATALMGMILEMYGRICTRLPSPEPFTPKRLNAVSRLVKAYPEAQKRDWWERYFRQVAETKFLNGGGKRGWRAGLDWLLEPWTVRQVLAGRYENRTV